MMNSVVNFAISAKDAGIDSTISANDVLMGILNTVYFAAGIVAVVVIIIAGIFYSISNGDPGKTKTAREAIIYAIVGLGVIMSAFVITGFVSGRFG